MGSFRWGGAAGRCDPACGLPTFPLRATSQCFAYGTKEGCPGETESVPERDHHAREDNYSNEHREQHHSLDPLPAHGADFFAATCEFDLPRCAERFISRFASWPHRDSVPRADEPFS